jgi:hypothetical protein
VAISVGSTVEREQVALFHLFLLLVMKIVSKASFMLQEAGCLETLIHDK